MGCLWDAFQCCVCKEGSEKQHLIDVKKGEDKIPVNDVNVLSYVTLSWITGLILKIYKNRGEVIRKEDLWECSDLETSSPNTDRLDFLWTTEVQSRGEEDASLLRVWLRFMRIPLLLLISGICVNSVVAFLMTGYITELIVKYLETGESSTPYAIGLVVGIFVGQIVMITSFTFTLLYGSQIGVRFRAGLMGLSYRKLLRLKEVKGETASEMVTIVGSDGQRVFLFCQMFVYLLAVPIALLIGNIYVYILIGPWCFINVGVFVFCYVIQVLLVAVISRNQAKAMSWTDKRIRKITEVLNSIKMIKMFAWEDPFTSAITEIRRKEARTNMWISMIFCTCSSLNPITSTLASIVTISVYAAAGNPITASTAFTLAVTMGYFRSVIAYIPLIIRLVADALVSFVRIKRLLLKEEYRRPGQSTRLDKCSLEFRDAVLDWNDEDDTQRCPVTEGISLTVTKGKLIGICGPVGSGKSSLLHAVIGRVDHIHVRKRTILSGHLAVSGSVAYSTQQAVIFNGTLRDNVLFGCQYEPEWFMLVMYACGLEPDIDMMPNAAQTEIGDRGINLSGGQKQRVSLARAVYSKSDIYLLDDPLSAVDVHVGKHIFHECIKKILKDKTVVLVSHQHQYLELCDEVVVMVDGVIVEQGTHVNLLAIGGHYTRLMAKHSSTVNDTSRTEDDKNVDRKEQGIYRVKKHLNERRAGLTDTDMDKHAKGMLTEEERVETGVVSLSTYKSYVDAAGGIGVAIATLMVYMITMTSLVFSEWWLGVWIQRTSTSPDGPDMAVSNLSRTTTPDFLNISTPTTNVSFTSENAGGMTDVYLVVYASTTAGIVVLGIIKGITGGAVMLRASRRLHDRAFKTVIKAPMKFFDANPPGRILNRFMKDVEEGDDFIPMFIDNSLQLLMTIVVSLAAAVIVLPWLLVAVAPLCIVLFFFKTIPSASIRQLKRYENTTLSYLISHIKTSCQGLDTIVAYHQQENFVRRCMEYIDETSTALFLFQCSMRWMELRLHVTASILVVAAAVVLFVTTESTDVAFAALSLMLCIKVVALTRPVIRTTNQLESRYTSMERLHEYEKLETEVDELSTSNPEENWPRQGNIHFSNVSMRYRSNLDPVLQNIDFEINAGQHVGIVGRTGAGKSSLAAALFRLTDLFEGHIYIDGVDVGLVSRKLLRCKLSTIPQDPVLFAGTLKYNLDPFGQYSDNQIWSALTQVHMLQRMQQKEMSLDTYIEENGGNLSVGERQLLCFARVILQRNKILVLDEATASIDTSTDAMIQETIRESFSDCTVLTIAHRLNTVLHCDVILVMEAGRVVESGTPQTLLADQHSHFSNMLRVQTMSEPC